MLVIYIAIAVRARNDANIIRRGFFKAYKDIISRIIMKSPGGTIIELMVSDNIYFLLLLLQGFQTAIIVCLL